MLANATTNAAKGTLNSATRSFTIDANDQLTKASDYDDVIIAYRNGVAGAGARHRPRGRGPGELSRRPGTTTSPRVLLIVFKQPGANVIETVDRIKKALPRLEAVIPPAVKVEVMSDRTETIRASVEDVEFTLALTIALVVLVIFLFLRNLRATIIPSLVVPLSLLGAAAVMYAVGFSLDNLSLMALTIAVGFVVDDAIVVVENIYRHIEEGMAPLEAALKGSREIGFTVLSISLSLVAVFIPLLLMGGIIGRLFREFAITVTVAIAVSAFVSLTLTPMLCARFLEPGERQRTAASTAPSRPCSMACTAATGARSTSCCGTDSSRCWCSSPPWRSPSVSTSMIPKGFFPTQDTGLIIGSRRRRRTSPRRDGAAAAQARQPWLRAIPTSAALAPSWAAPAAAHRQHRPLLHRAQAPRRAQGHASDDHRAAAPAARQGRRREARSCRPRRTSPSAAASPAAQYQYTLQDADLDELNAWAPKMLDKLKTLPQLADVSSDQQTNAPQLAISINRDPAARFGIQPQVIDDTLNDAFGQRQVAQYFTQTNTYFVVLEVLPQCRTTSRRSTRSTSSRRSTGSRCRSRPSSTDDPTGRPALGRRTRASSRP